MQLSCFLRQPPLSANSCQPALSHAPTPPSLGPARLELSPFGRDVASAASAVVASYFVIGLYAWSAMAEEDAEGAKGD
jgi:hypothetical protein